jgi:hypothetical protein
MLVAASALSVMLVGVLVVVVGLLIGGAVNLWGATAERLAASGRRPGKVRALRKPPDQDGAAR